MSRMCRVNGSGGRGQSRFHPSEVPSWSTTVSSSAHFVRRRSCWTRKFVLHHRSRSSASRRSVLKKAFLDSLSCPCSCYVTTSIHLLLSYCTLLHLYTKAPAVHCKIPLAASVLVFCGLPRVQHNELAAKKIHQTSSMSPLCLPDSKIISECQQISAQQAAISALHFT